MMLRDSQKSRAYRAENVLPECLGAEYRISHEAGQRFLDAVVAREYVQRHYRPVAVALLQRAPGSGASAGNGRIRCSDTARTKMILLHELAHLLDDLEEHRERNRLAWSVRLNTPRRAGHGWRWAAIYLDLVRNVLGVEVHDRLRAAFKANRVRYTAPRAKRVLTEEQKTQLYARLTGARFVQVRRQA